MAVDICAYRVTIGIFQRIAGMLVRKLHLFVKYTAISFFLLVYAQKMEHVTVSFLLFYISVCFNIDVLSPPVKRQMPQNSTIIIQHIPSKCHNDLLMKSGDIQHNPSPTNYGELCTMHVNARSLKNKIDLFEAESHQFDIITISESCLSPADSNNSLLIKNFHPPVCLDRANDSHGGVAIYVKDTLCCKPRTDLQVDGLEAVWVETKINQESLLVGSFY